MQRVRTPAAAAEDTSALRVALQHAAVQILLTADPADKMERMKALLSAIDCPPEEGGVQGADEAAAAAAAAAVPDAPPLPTRPVLVGPTQTGRHSSVPVNVYLLHSLAHIEYNAVQSYCDTIARFVTDPAVPLGLFLECAAVARDEAVHFGWLAARLAELGSGYGALPAHDGLWRDALATKDSLPARLVVLPLVAESRALDSHDRLVNKLVSVGDAASAAIVGRICSEEVAHVAMGVRWFRWLCDRDGCADHAAEFHRLVRQVVRSPLPRPFNDAARQVAGMPPEWYLPVSKPLR